MDVEIILHQLATVSKNFKINFDRFLEGKKEEKTIVAILYGKLHYSLVRKKYPNKYGL